MNGTARIAAFSALLVAIFAGAALLGGAVDPAGSDADAGNEADHSEAQVAASGRPGDGARHDDGARDAGGPEAHQGGVGKDDAGTHAAGGDGHGGGSADAAAPPGLQVADDGYRLVVGRARLPRGERRAALTCRIVDASGAPVRRFEVEHEKRMHFIVVRRDLTGFQHLHPTMRDDGTWATRVDLRRGGAYRVFADFKREGAQRTLGADVSVGAPYRPLRLPGARPTARTRSGLQVTLRSRRVRAGDEGRVEFEVRDGEEVVTDRLQPYLGAAGHLVALRAGDLAYLHTHPEGDTPAFAVDYPSAGAYRLFLQFRYEGEVHTAAFTQEVAT